MTFWKPQHLGGKDEVGQAAGSMGCAGDRPQSCCPEQRCPGQGSSTALCPRRAQALAHLSPKLQLLAWRLPCSISFPHGHSRSPRIPTTRRGPQRALAPCWCLALMLSKAYLLLGFYLHPLSLSARGSPPCCATFPERACSRCGRHYRSPNAAACPQSLTPGPALIMRARRGPRR